MKILVIASHPNLSQSRVNKRWLEELHKDNTITVHNLSEVYPDEVINKEKEQALLLAHDRIVFQYPFHWYNIPPLLRKWQDVVLEYNWAFGPNGDKLRGKEYLVALSVGGPADAYQAGGYNNFTLSELLKPMQQTAHLTQMEYLPYFNVHDAIRLTESELEQSACDYVAHIKNPLLNPKVAKAKLDAEMQENGTAL